MKPWIYWFRSDLRVLDSPALEIACTNTADDATNHATYLLPVYVMPPDDVQTAWGFARMGTLRRRYLIDSLIALDQELQKLGSRLIVLQGDVAQTLAALSASTKAKGIFCENIAAPEEQDEINQLQHLGINVQACWHSSMLDPRTLPFAVDAMPDVFTQFRQQIEANKLRSRTPIQTPLHLPPFPKTLEIETLSLELLRDTVEPEKQTQSFAAGTTCGLEHLDRYFSSECPHSYKQTRNQLTGADYSTKFSTWLANGAISAPVIIERLTEYEATRGANDSTYWIWFELLWRDYFRLLHLKYGRSLYLRDGLNKKIANDHWAKLVNPLGGHAQKLFEQWTQGQTENSLVNAGMNELRNTGLLSNRMRQVVASYLIYDLKLDWRAGAAWFESQLLDFDIYSNQGNWLYIAGRGTDPRGGRRMNLEKQALEHDPDGHYRKQWAESRT